MTAGSYDRGRGPQDLMDKKVRTGVRIHGGFAKGDSKSLHAVICREAHITPFKRKGRGHSW